ncbi:MAG: hypothetical protein HQL26_07385 [Candidatus Omnitrophica bacterium]|nr:hypothetical protein [Candidatus Omnitrophota bacterium]
MDFIEKMGFVAAVAMPLFNIPLIIKMFQRKSSEDISLMWALGIWGCIILMAPAGFRSPDMVWRTYNYMNVIFFTFVVIATLKYRKWGK